MATAVVGYWPGMEPEQYGRAVERINRDEEFPAGMKLHTSGFAPDGLHVFDIWDSERAYKQFMQRRILPALKQEGYQGDPELQFYPVHNLYIPGLEELSGLGASMLPT
jgi:hypothetical protein